MSLQRTTKFIFFVLLHLAEIHIFYGLKALCWGGIRVVDRETFYKNCQGSVPIKLLLHANIPAVGFFISFPEGYRFLKAHSSPLSEAHGDPCIKETKASDHITTI